MSLYGMVTNLYQVVINLFWVTIDGSMLHKLLSRLAFFPTILRMTLREGPNYRWYDRIDQTVILGAIPFKSQSEKLVKADNVRAVVSLNEAYELTCFNCYTCTMDEDWAKLGVKRHWISVIDFQPPSLPSIWGGLKVIDECGRRNESVYVHCKAGKGRSTIVVACYLMKNYNFNPAEAISFIKERRPQIRMNPRQKKRLEEFHKQLRTKTE